MSDSRGTIASDTMTHAASHWPPAVDILNARGASPVVLLCEHASNYIPSEYDNLGIPSADLQRHIAWDIGAAGVVRQLSRLLDAPAFLGGFSRLLIDVNRSPHASSSIVERSDATQIPGNTMLAARERQRRVTHIYEPFHQAVREHLAGRVAVGRRTVIVAIHSFTPSYQGVARQWHAGVVFERSSAFVQATLERLRAADRSMSVGANEPYGVTPGDGYGFLVYGDNIGNPAVLIEIRQDLIARPADEAFWAQRLAETLAIDVALSC
jgi:predicted N-formylglutamate amidohydrolase